MNQKSMPRELGEHTPQGSFCVLCLFGLIYVRLRCFYVVFALFLPDVLSLNSDIIGIDPATGPLTRICRKTQKMPEEGEICPKPMNSGQKSSQHSTYSTLGRLGQTTTLFRQKVVEGVYFILWRMQAMQEKAGNIKHEQPPRARELASSSPATHAGLNTRSRPFKTTPASFQIHEMAGHLSNTPPSAPLVATPARQRGP